jgi:hypothetical protein
MRKKVVSGKMKKSEKTRSDLAMIHFGTTFVLYIKVNKQEFDYQADCVNFAQKCALIIFRKLIYKKISICSSIENHPVFPFKTRGYLVLYGLSIFGTSFFRINILNRNSF